MAPNGCCEVLEEIQKIIRMYTSVYMENVRKGPFGK